MNNKIPLVSICIPTYNGSAYIRECIQSALAQSYENIEIVISDDDSKDGTIEIIQSLLSKTTIPYFIHNHKPKGIGENWNNCVRQSNGKYIKFLFQDDVLEKDCIEKMVGLCMSDDKIGMVYCKRKIIYEQNNNDHLKWISRNKNLHQSWSKLKIKQGVIKGSRYLKDLSLMREPLNKIGEPTAVLLKRECFDTVGFFNKELKQTLDFEYWYRVMKDYKIGFLDEELISFRLHPEQATFTNNFSFSKEMNVLNESLFRNLFWQLHFNRQWKLFKSQSRFGHFVRLVKRII